MLNACTKKSLETYWMPFGYSLSSEAVVMRQLKRGKRLWRRLLTRSHKRTSMRPSRSCWNGTTSALQPEEITSKGTWVSCVYYQYLALWVLFTNLVYNRARSFRAISLLLFQLPVLLFRGTNHYTALFFSCRFYFSFLSIVFSLFF